MKKRNSTNFKFQRCSSQVTIMAWKSWYWQQMKNLKMLQGAHSKLFQIIFLCYLTYSRRQWWIAIDWTDFFRWYLWLNLQKDGQKGQTWTQMNLDIFLKAVFAAIRFFQEHIPLNDVVPFSVLYRLIQFRVFLHLFLL